jgi:hypothetical protein
MLGRLLIAAVALTLATLIPAQVWIASFPVFETSVGQGDPFELSLGTNVLDLQYDPTANGTGGATYRKKEAFQC